MWLKYLTVFSEDKLELEVQLWSTLLTIERYFFSLSQGKFEIKCLVISLINN